MKAIRKPTDKNPALKNPAFRARTSSALKRGTFCALMLSALFLIVILARILVQM